MTWHFKGLLAGACALAILVSGGRVAPAQDMPPEILASQLRGQGYRCDAPVTAQRDAQLSKPEEAAWILKCANASYRMRLIPDMAARIEPLD
ncbi:hypothetical protein [Microvirga massiliensis]|uniref:hypothetical protein n=1 Tax=Microvirga massiliensis TaxID=1033741 RepID=UPI00062BD9FD|nr:hypothetical protein [Microvirga massiliensis]